LHGEGKGGEYWPGPADTHFAKRTPSFAPPPLPPLLRSRTCCGWCGVLCLPPVQNQGSHDVGAASTGAAGGTLLPHHKPMRTQMHSSHPTAFSPLPSRSCTSPDVLPAPAGTSGASYPVAFKLTHKVQKVVTLEVNPLETVAEVKGRLAAVAGLSGPLQLIVVGQKLADLSTWGSLGLDKESVIHCTETAKVGNADRAQCGLGWVWSVGGGGGGGSCATPALLRLSRTLCVVRCLLLPCKIRKILTRGRPPVALQGVRVRIVCVCTHDAQVTSHCLVHASVPILCFPRCTANSRGECRRPLPRELQAH
jgi:hypothetical protein